MAKNKGMKKDSKLAVNVVGTQTGRVDATVVNTENTPKMAEGGVVQSPAGTTESKLNETVRRANIMAMHKMTKEQWESLTDEEKDAKTKQFDAVPPRPTPSVADIGANNKGGKRGPTGPRTGDAMGAKPLVRKLMGTPGEDGTYPAFSVDMLCSATKKSEVNIRTILSDLRSPKYCGAGGVFLTHSFKEGTVTMYRFGTPPVVAAATVATPASPDGAGPQAVAQEGTPSPAAHSAAAH